MRYAIIIVLALALGGCPTFGFSPDQLNALAKDPATVCGSVTSVYGKLQFARTNITSGNVSCTQDGLAVKSDGAVVGIPITVMPQVRIESPGFVQTPGGSSVLAPIPGAWGPVPVPR